MRDIFREYGLFVMVTLVSATVWVVISYIMHWGGSNTALYANEDDSEALQNKFNITDIQEPRFVNFYITDNNGKNTANLRNVIGYNAPGTKSVGTGKGSLNVDYKLYGGIPYNTVYGYTAYMATGGADGLNNIFNDNKALSIEDYFSPEDLANNRRTTRSLNDIYLNPSNNYDLNIHVYRIFTDEEQKAIQSKYSAVTTNQVYSTNLNENNNSIYRNALNNSNTPTFSVLKHNLILSAGMMDNYGDFDTSGVSGLYTKPSQDILKTDNAYDVSYKYNSDKSSIEGKTEVSIMPAMYGPDLNNSNEWILEVRTGNHVDFSWTRDSSSGVAVITSSTGELTDYDISTELSKYMWNLADTIRIKFFLSTATNANLLDYNNTLSKMIEAGDQKADITNKAVYLINTTFKYKLVYQYKNNLTGMKAEQAYTITVDSNNS